MRRHFRFMAPNFLLFGIAFTALMGLAVVALWNWLMPPLFGLTAITYWQALGLLVLSRILFGGFRGAPGGGRYWRHRLLQRWERRMTPEEREKFREGLRRRA